MLRNYFKITIRNLKRYKGYSLINIIGLGIGMACCILILLWVQDELSYDQYHTNADRIYRINEDLQIGDVGEHSASVPHPLGVVLPMEYSNSVESLVRFYNFQAPSLAVAYEGAENKRFNEPRFFFVD